MKPEQFEEGIIQKELHIFYLLDVSGSMDGAPIAALNDAMRDTIFAMTDIRAEAAIKIAVMTYANEAKWITCGKNNLENVEDFEWSDVEAGGMTYLGSALDLLKSGLSRNTMMASATGNKVPIIIFMTDGFPNDDWESALNEIRQNKWFSTAIKIGIALGDDADLKVLADVVGDKEAVIRANNLALFKSMLRVVSVVSGLSGSTSQTVTTQVTGAEIVQAAKEEIKSDPSFDPEADELE